MRKKSLFLLLPLFGLSLSSCSKTISFAQASSIKDEIIKYHEAAGFAYSTKAISFSSNVKGIDSNFESNSFSNQRGSYFRLIQADSNSDTQRCLFRLGAEFYDARVISKKKTFMRLSASSFSSQIAELQDIWVPIMQEKAEESYSGLQALFDDASHLHDGSIGSGETSSSSSDSSSNSSSLSSSLVYDFENDSYMSDPSEKLDLRASYTWYSNDETLQFNNAVSSLRFSKGLPTSWTENKDGYEHSSSFSYYFDFSITSFSKPSLLDYTEVSSFD